MMRAQIEAVFREALPMAATEEERRSLDQACRACLALLAIADLEEREKVLRVLERLSLHSEIADALANERVVPFSRRQRVRRNSEARPYFVD